MLEPTLYLNVQDATRTPILHQIQVLLLTMVTNLGYKVMVTFKILLKLQLLKSKDLNGFQINVLSSGPIVLDPQSVQFSYANHSVPEFKWLHRC